MGDLNIAAYITDPFGDDNVGTAFDDIQFSNRKHQSKIASLQEKYEYLSVTVVENTTDFVDQPSLESQTSLNGKHLSCKKYQMFFIAWLVFVVPAPLPPQDPITPVDGTC